MRVLLAWTWHFYCLQGVLRALLLQVVLGLSYHVHGTHCRLTAEMPPFCPGKVRPSHPYPSAGQVGVPTSTRLQVVVGVFKTSFGCPSRFFGQSCSDCVMVAWPWLTP